MGIMVRLELDHLSTTNAVTTVTDGYSSTVLAPNLLHNGTIRSTLKSYVEEFLFIPEEDQLMVAPCFTRLVETDTVEDIYSCYKCDADNEITNLYVDEKKLVFFGQENGKTVELENSRSLEDYHILDKSVVQLKKIPKCLPKDGGRVFVDTKDGILPVIGITSQTRILELKRKLEKITGIPPSQQLLSSIGRVMHDDLCLDNFDGIHKIYEDSVIDLVQSGDANKDQLHRRMKISVNIDNEKGFILVVQGKTLVQCIMEIVESRTGIGRWQQRILFSGKVLQEKKSLGDYFVYPESILHVSVLKSASTLATSVRTAQLENSGDLIQKPVARKLKLVKSSKGHITGTVIIPVLVTDTVSDLRRKLKRILHPLVEKNLSTISFIGGLSPMKNQLQTNSKDEAEGPPLNEEANSQSSLAVLNSPLSRVMLKSSSMAHSPSELQASVCTSFDGIYPRKLQVGLQNSIGKQIAFANGTRGSMSKQTPRTALDQTRADILRTSNEDRHVARGVGVWLDESIKSLKHITVSLSKK